MSEMKPYGQKEYQTMQEGVEAIKKTEPTLIIKSEDLQDPKKLAFVKAIVGSMLADNVGSNLVGIWGKRFCLGDALVYEINLKISDIKLEPRLLMCEDVEVEVNGVRAMIETVSRNKIWINTENNMVVRSLAKNLIFKPYELKPSLQWLKENFEVI
jgi:hypothetical protein